ncbi:MAG: VOC family protein [Pseudomonadota bacterium]
MALGHIEEIGIRTLDVPTTCRFLHEALGLARLDDDAGRPTAGRFDAGSAELVVHAASASDPGAPPGVGMVRFAAGSSDMTGAGLPAPFGVAPTHGDSADGSPRNPAQGAGQTPTATGDGIISLDYVSVECDVPEAIAAQLESQCHCAAGTTERVTDILQVTEAFVSDKYGAVYHTRTPQMSGGVRVQFVTSDSAAVALTNRFTVHPKAGATTQPTRAPDAPHRSAAVAHIALAIDDVDRIWAEFRRSGWPVLAGGPVTGLRGRRVLMMDPVTFGGELQIHLTAETL